MAFFLALTNISYRLLLRWYLLIIANWQTRIHFQHYFRQSNSFGDIFLFLQKLLEIDLRNGVYAIECRIWLSQIIEPILKILIIVNGHHLKLIHIFLHLNKPANLRIRNIKFQTFHQKFLHNNKHKITWLLSLLSPSLKNYSAPD